MVKRLDRTDSCRTPAKVPARCNDHEMSDVNQPSPPPSDHPVAPARAKEPWFKKRWVQLVAVGVVALGVGGAAGVAGADPTATSEYEQLESDNASLETELSEAEEKAALVDEVDQRTAELDKREKDLDDRASDADELDAELSDREKAVGIAEKKVAANTVDGDGMYAVGDDIKAGRYKTKGQAGCYYAVLRDTAGGINSIVTNGNIDGAGYVSVSNGQYLELSGCAEWVRQ